MPSRPFFVRVLATPTKILERNPDRSSYYIVNQHPALNIWLQSGPSHGSKVSTAGNHEGDMLGPNGGALYDDDDLEEVWGISTAPNTRVKVTEKTLTGKMMRLRREGVKA